MLGIKMKKIAGEVRSDFSKDKGALMFRDSKTGYVLKLTDADLSKHLLIMGEHGAGKTNAIKLTIPQLDEENNKEIIFDPKGDYMREFYRLGQDIVISGSIQDKERMYYWNLFREVQFSSVYEKEKKEFLKGMMTAFFKGKENQTQPFFSDAAMDLFSDIIINQLRLLWDLPDYKELQQIIESTADHDTKESAISQQKELFNQLADTELNNAKLAEIMDHASLDYFRNLLGPKFPHVYGYLGKTGVYNTGLSVIGEMRSVYAGIFQHTMFTEYEPGRDIAICDFINYGTGRLFLEYSITASASLAPVYTVLIDAAIKTQLANYRTCKNNLYLILDELSMAPLSDLQMSLNQGRDRGMRVIVGIQSIEQLRDIYGEAAGAVLTESFSTIFVFQLTGAPSSREYAVKRIAQHENYLAHKQYQNELNIVDEQKILCLHCGQMICKQYGHLYPVVFTFERYKETEISEKLLERSFDTFLGKNR